MDRIADKDLDIWYQRRFDLTAHRGWDDLIEQVNEMRAGYQDVRRLRSDEERTFRQGQLDILDWLAGMADSCRAAYDDMLQREQEGDNDASL
jgi:hypothetical protein